MWLVKRTKRNLGHVFTENLIAATTSASLSGLFGPVSVDDVPLMIGFHAASRIKHSAEMPRLEFKRRTMAMLKGRLRLSTS